MEKIQRGLRISAIVEFFIAVVCAIIIYLNKEQIINIQLENIKIVALLAITLCLLVIIEDCQLRKLQEFKHFQTGMSLAEVQVIETQIRN